VRFKNRTPEQSLCNLDLYLLKISAIVLFAFALSDLLKVATLKTSPVLEAAFRCSLDPTTQ
jgi:hypothetical protein